MQWSKSINIRNSAAVWNWVVRWGGVCIPYMDVPCLVHGLVEAPVFDVNWVASFVLGNMGKAMSLWRYAISKHRNPEMSSVAGWYEQGWSVNTMYIEWRPAPIFWEHMHVISHRRLCFEPDFKALSLSIFWLDTILPFNVHDVIYFWSFHRTTYIDDVQCSHGMLKFNNSLLQMVDHLQGSSVTLL